MTEITEQEQMEDKSLTDELESVLTDIATEAVPEKEKKKRIVLVDETVLTIDQREYQLVENYREAFDIEQINERYSDVLNRYDYIVGDIGFEQLRLKGFFSENQKRMPVEQRIGALQDYLYEYCNFGCAYFVLEREGAGTRKEKPQSRNKRNNRKPNPKGPNQVKQGAHIQEKQGKAIEKPQPKNKKAPVIKNRREKENKGSNKPVAQQKANSVQDKGKRGFTIRQKEE